MQSCPVCVEISNVADKLKQKAKDAMDRREQVEDSSVHILPLLVKPVLSPPSSVNYVI